MILTRPGLWAATFHSAKNVKTLGTIVHEDHTHHYGDVTNMGSVFDELGGSKSLRISLTSAEGSHAISPRPPLVLDRAAAGSLEASIRKEGFEFAIVDVRTPRWRRKWPHRLMGPEALTSVPADLTDLVFYMRAMTPNTLAPGVE